MRIVALLLFACCVYHHAYSQPTFSKRSISDTVTLADMAITTDGNAVIATTDTGYYVSDKITLVKMNQKGNVIWSNRYRLAINGYITPYFIAPCRDGGVLAVSTASSYTNQGGNLVCKIDSNGSLLWAKQIKPVLKRYQLQPMRIVEAPDQSVYMVNYLTGHGFDIQKLDRNGNALWRRYILTDSTINVQTNFGPAAATADGGLVVSTTSFYGFETKYYNHLFRITADGKAEGEYTLQKPFDDYDPLKMIKPEQNGSLRLIYTSYLGYAITTLLPKAATIQLQSVGSSLFNLQTYLRLNRIHYFDNISFKDVYNVESFMADGGLFSAILYYTRKITRVNVKKWDSLGRACPDYFPYGELKDRGIKKVDVTLSSFYFNKPLVDLTITDTVLSVQPFTLFQSVCSGEAPLMADNRTALPAAETGLSASLAISPNPVTSYADIHVATPSACTANIVLSDMSGRVVKSVLLPLQKGRNLTRINIADLSHGVYIVNVKTQTGTTNQKLVKQ